MSTEYYSTGLGVFLAQRKTGRCANGAERDGGTVVHAVNPDPFGGTGWRPALCGTEPGRLSAGWGDASGPVSCSRCRGKLERLNATTACRRCGDEYLLDSLEEGSCEGCRNVEAGLCRCGEDPVSGYSACGECLATEYDDHRFHSEKEEAHDG